MAAAAGEAGAQKSAPPQIPSRLARLPRAGVIAAQDDATTKAVREASVEQIAATPGFTRAVAEKVLEGL